MIKQALYKNIINKLAALILKKDLYALKSMMDSSEVGGAPLLGVSRPVIKAHGSSDEKLFYYTIKQAEQFVKNKAVDKMKEHFEQPV